VVKRRKNDNKKKRNGKGFKEIFDSTYLAPQRQPKLAHHLMVVGILMLLFIGFNRLWHFSYIRLDAMLCDFFRLTNLPVCGHAHSKRAGSKARASDSMRIV